MPLNPQKPLRRSRDQGVIGGVCAGIAEHIGWDPTNVRVVYLLATLLLAGFPGLFVYLVLWAVVPQR